MDEARLAEVFSALGNELRLRIVTTIAGHKEMCICELVDLLDVSQANLSRHVGVLRDAGVLVSRKKGVLILHRVCEDAIAEASAELCEEIGELHDGSADVDVDARLADRCYT